MRKITSIKQLIEEVDRGIAHTGMTNLLKSLEIPKAEFEEFTSWNPERYTRNKIYGTSGLEILILCFEEGQESKIHDLDSQEGWIYVIEGSITKEQYVYSEVYEKMELVQTVNLTERSFTYENDYIGFHKGINTNNGRTVCLVFYADPVRKTKVYDETTGDFAEYLPYYDMRYDRVQAVDE